MGLIDACIRQAVELDEILASMSKQYDIVMKDIQVIAYRDSMERGISTQDELYEISEKLKRKESVIE